LVSFTERGGATRTPEPLSVILTAVTSAVSLSSRRQGDALIVQVSGRLDHGTSKTFSDEIVRLGDMPEHAGLSFVLDLSGLEYISSSGLHGFIVASRHAKDRQRRIYAAAAQPIVAEMFEISHLNLVIQVFPTVDEAIAMASNQVPPPGERRKR
jgi:anti-sigma B factor antagonist